MLLILRKQHYDVNYSIVYSIDQSLSLLIVIKLFEKILMKKPRPVIEKYLIKEQVHRRTHVIEFALEEKQVYSAVFLNVAQPFDKVLHGS